MMCSSMGMEDARVVLCMVLLGVSSAQLLCLDTSNTPVLLGLCWQRQQTFTAPPPVSNIIFCNKALRSCTPFLLSPVNQNFLGYQISSSFLTPKDMCHQPTSGNCSSLLSHTKFETDYITAFKGMCSSGLWFLWYFWFLHVFLTCILWLKSSKSKKKSENLDPELNKEVNIIWKAGP